MPATPISPATTPFYGGGQAVNPANVIFGRISPPANAAATGGGIIYIDTLLGNAYLSTVPGNWEQVAAGAGSVSTLTGNSGGALSPDVNGNINVVGSAGTQVAGVGSTLTITATPSTFSWNIAAVGIELVPENAYTVAAGAQAFTLPAACVIGDEIGLVLQGGTSWTITPSGAQSIQVGPDIALGAGGSVASTTDGDTIWIVCTATNSTWLAFGYTGNLDVTP